MTLRRAETSDARKIAALFRASRAEAMPWLPVLHSFEEDIAFFERRIEAGGVTAAVEGERILGFAALEGETLRHLYVRPGEQGRGIGSALLDHVKSLGARLELYTFRDNTRARAFYEHRGFRAVAFGVGGEENLPDVLYEWP